MKSTILVVNVFSFIVVAIYPLNLCASSTADPLIAAFDQGVNLRTSIARKISERPTLPITETRMRDSLNPKQRKLYEDYRSAVRELRDNHALFDRIPTKVEGESAMTTILAHVLAMANVDELLGPNGDDPTPSMINGVDIVLGYIKAGGRTDDAYNKAEAKVLEARRKFAESMKKNGGGRKI